MAEVKDLVSVYRLDKFAAPFLAAMEIRRLHDVGEVRQTERRRQRHSKATREHNEQ